MSNQYSGKSINLMFQFTYSLFWMGERTRGF